MVTFVLENDCGESPDCLAGVAYACFGVHYAVAYIYLHESQHFAPSSRDAEAAFRPAQLLAPHICNADVRVHFEGLRALVEALHGHHSSRNAHLGCSQPDSVLLG